MRQKGFAPILIIIILSLIGIAGAYYFGARKRGVIPTVTQTPTATAIGTNSKPLTDTTASWKTHQNDEYGYVIKYPSDWFIQDKANFGFKMSNKQFSSFNGTETPREGEIFLNIYYSHSAFENGLGAIEYTSEDGIELVADTIFINKNNSLGVTITYRKNEPDLIDLKNKIDQIYSTFRSFD